ncbi:MAG: hypothetical protein ABIQ35_15200 [Verrucomicrobiota bacterium]
MKSLLILGTILCGLLAIEKVYGLIYKKFSVKQAVYAAAFAATACSLVVAAWKEEKKERNPPPEVKDDDGSSKT